MLREIQFSGTTQAVIDLSSLPAGVYLVSVGTTSGTTTGRIILQR